MNNKDRNSYVKTQISKTLIRLMKDTDIDQIDIRSLCNEAGVGRASFYRNYSSKEQVILEHASMLIQQWGNDFESDPASSPFNVFGSIFEHFKKNKEFYTLLYKQNLSDIILETIKEKVGLIPSLSNKEAYDKAFFSYGLYGWICEWIKRGMKESADDINQMLLSSNSDLYN